MYKLHFILSCFSLYAEISPLFGLKSFHYADRPKFHRNIPWIIANFSIRVKVAVRPFDIADILADMPKLLTMPLIDIQSLQYYKDPVD